MRNERRDIFIDRGRERWKGQRGMSDVGEEVE